MRNSPFCEEENAPCSSPEWVGYRKALFEQGVPEPYRLHYEKWVWVWLESEVFHSRAADPAQVFSTWLEAHHLPTWQCRQAYQAVRIWLSLVVPDPIVPTQSWGEVLERFRLALLEQHYSANTVSTYTDWGRRFSQRHPVVPIDSEQASKQAQEFLRSLVHELNLSPGSLSLARNALAWVIKRVLGFTLELGDKGDAHHAPRLPSVLSGPTVLKLLSGCSAPWDLFFGMQ